MAEKTNRPTTVGRYVSALAFALLLALSAVQGASADTKTINDRASLLADGCAKSGGKGSTSIDSEGHVIFTCKGAKGGDYECASLDRRARSRTRSI